MTEAPFVVAIDGPAASGKSTTARRAAERLSFRYLDTGAMYRALTRKVLDAGIDPQDAAAVAEFAERVALRLEAGPGGDRTIVDGEDVTDRLRGDDVTRAVSHVASVPAVRRAMVRIQREVARAGPCVVEGRDIGTVVFPDAPVKIFLVASLQERARRRLAEHGNPSLSLAAIAAEIERRDSMDQGRDDSPLLRAPDAVELDTTGLSIEATVDEIVRIVREARGAF